MKLRLYIKNESKIKDDRSDLPMTSNNNRRYLSDKPSLMTNNQMKLQLVITNETENTDDISGHIIETNKKRRFQSYNPSVTTCACDNIEDRIATIMKSSFNKYFNELDRRSDIRLMKIMDNVYAALSKDKKTKTNEETQIIDLTDDEISTFPLT